MSNLGMLTLKVLTPEGIIFEKGDLTGINIPLADGCPIGIRPGHAPLIAETLMGTIRFYTKDIEKKISLHAGVMEIRDNLVTLLTAGELEKTSEEIIEPAAMEYDRLMQTLIKQIQLEDETEQAKNES